MDNITLLAYKNRLLKAGIPYAVVKRNLRELQDHHDDLQQQAQVTGLSDAKASAAASHQLGNPEQLISAMLERPELRSKLHRFPIGMTVVLPILAHFSICALLLIGLLVPVMTIKSIGFIDLLSSQDPWIINSLGSLKVLLMYVLTPILGCALAFVGISRHVSKRFWMTGLVLLCLLGSSLTVHLAWPDPATDGKGMVGAGYGVSNPQSYERDVLQYTLRLTINLLLCGCFARHYQRKEQADNTVGKSL